MGFSSEFLEDLLVVLMSVESVVDIGCDESSLFAIREKFSMRGHDGFGRLDMVVVDVLASDYGTVDVHIII